jgi:nitrous oxidase accessory protein NosD
MFHNHFPFGAAVIGGLFLGIAALPGSSRAALLKVGSCGTYATIQSAVDKATAGSVIDVCPGTYPEQVTIDKSLTLRGISFGYADSAVITSPAGGMVQNATSLTSSGYAIYANVLVESGATVKISNLTVDSAGNQVACGAGQLVGIFFQNASGTVNWVTTRNQLPDGAICGSGDGLGIFVQSGNSGTSTVSVLNSSVHDYSKNGITGNGVGTTITITGCKIRGAGPTTAVAQNGIQIAYGATGAVKNNTIADDVWSPLPAGDQCDAADGILLYGASGVTVSGNQISNTQFGIGVPVDEILGNPADNNIIKSNVINGTLLLDGIDICGSNNTVESNRIAGVGQAGIHVDAACGASCGSTPATPAGNVISSNSINEACAGILSGPASGNTIGTNTFANVGNTRVTGSDTCP